MNQQKKDFILRQIQYVSKQEPDPQKVLQQVLSKSLPAATSDQIMQDYKHTGSMIKTLNNSGILKLDPHFLEHLSDLEPKNGLIHFDLLNEIEQTNKETLKLLRYRISSGLTYAMTLLVIATVIFYTVTNKILPQFAEIYASFGQQLPSITQFALQWQDSFIPPTFVTVVFILVIGFIQTRLKKLSADIDTNNTLKHLPFLNQVFIFSQTLRSLGYLKIMLKINQPIEEWIKHSSAQLKAMQRYCPNALSDLQTAQSLNTAINEVDFQISEFANYADEVITNACRKFNLITMAMIIGFIAFIVFATYLPIFQLGSII